MKVKNKYVIRSCISEAKFRQITLLSSENLSVTQIFHLTRLSRETIHKYLTAIRLRILELSQLQSVSLVGQIEVDESYFGVRCVRGKRGRGTRGKTIVFSLLKRGDKVYTGIVPDYKGSLRARPVLRVLLILMVGGGIMDFVDFGYKKHFRVHHGKNEFARVYDIL